MTHDLIGRILFATDWSLRRVIVNALEDNTFFACLDMIREEEERAVDCRPSDAIALAVQLRKPDLRGALGARPGRADRLRRHLRLEARSSTLRSAGVSPLMPTSLTLASTRSSS